MENQGWITVHRKIRSWEWYTDVNTCHLFMHLLLSANHKDKKHQGVLIKKGQYKTGRIKLATETGLTEQQIRTCLKRLESTSEITIAKHNKFSIITITNWNEYQQKTKQSTSEITSNQPATNQQLTTNNNVNNKNNANNIEDLPKWLPIDDWVAFKEMRQEIKKPMSQLAESRMIKKLDRLRNDGYDPSRLLDRSMINKWQDVFEDSSCKVKGEFSGMFG